MWRQTFASDEVYNLQHQPSVISCLPQTGYVNCTSHVTSDGSISSDNNLWYDTGSTKHRTYQWFNCQSMVTASTAPPCLYLVSVKVPFDFHIKQIHFTAGRWCTTYKCNYQTAQNNVVSHLCELFMRTFARIIRANSHSQFHTDMD